MTELWGPSFWKTLHFITFTYSDFPNKDDKKLMYDLFDNIKERIPCFKCKRAFKQFLIHVPIDEFLYNKNSLIYWLYIIHNTVNFKLNKPYYTIENLFETYNVFGMDYAEIRVRILDMLRYKPMIIQYIKELEKLPDDENPLKIGAKEA